MGAERRSSWKCSSCRTKSPQPPASPEVASLDVILGEIRDMKRQLNSLPTLVADVKTIKEDISDLKSANAFLSSKVEDQSIRLTGIESRVLEIEPLQATVDIYRNEVRTMKGQLSTSDQRSRLNNVEIKGIPIRKDENLFAIIDTISNKVNYVFSQTQINYLYRIPLHNTKEKAIVVSFLNRYIKEEFVAAARAVKNLTAADVGFRESPNRVYVNDHLNAELKSLLSKVKLTAKEKNFSYVWVKYGKIHVRKNDTSRVFVVTCESDLNKFV